MKDKNRYSIDYKLVDEDETLQHYYYVDYEQYVKAYSILKKSKKVTAIYVYQREYDTDIIYLVHRFHRVVIKIFGKKIVTPFTYTRKGIL